MEYNKLTEKLLAEGYNTENYPSYVKIGHGYNRQDPLDNFDGGFVYQRTYTETIVYQTGCGCFVLGKNVINDLGYRGIEWNHENDCPVVYCPYGNKNCIHNHPLLRELGIDGHPLCACHSTDKQYDYENSIEYLDKKSEERKAKTRDAFIAERNGRACIHQMNYDEHAEKWSMIYDPMKCAKHGCMGYCPLRGRELEHKKGNIYVDKKYTSTRHDDTFFDGEVCISIRKGVRFFPSPINIEICREVAQKCGEKIKSHFYWNEGSRLQMLSNPETLEICNIRAESKPSRDLMQDLADIKAGITITHDSDSIKKYDEQKKMRRAAALEKKKKALAKRLIAVGINNIPPHSVDYKHAQKWFSKDELAELEVLHLKKKDEDSYSQITIFDIKPVKEVIIYENN